MHVLIEREVRNEPFQPAIFFFKLTESRGYRLSRWAHFVFHS